MIDDLRQLAQRKLPRLIFDFVDGGAGDERTLQRNYGRFDGYALLGRALVDAGTRDSSCRLFGQAMSMPVFVSPTGSSGLLWPRGEAEAAKACSAAGIPMMVSAAATLSIEEVAEAAPGPKWLQVFLYRDRAITREFAIRAQAAGYSALCLTVDCPLLGHRERDTRNGFTINPRLSMRHALDLLAHAGWWMRMARHPRVTFRNFERHGAGNIVNMAQFISSIIDPGVTWADLECLRSIWTGPLIVKGVLRGDEAKRMVEMGCDAILVSNHGGRQLDGTIATIDALPDVVDAVAGRVPVLVDGGVRRGTDILKALALGASAVGIGRAHLWGLAAGGEAGVARALAILRAELDLAMAIGGWPNLSALDRDSIRRLDGAGHPQPLAPFTQARMA